MKPFLLSSIFVNVLVLPWGLGHANSLLGGLQGIDSSFAKLRFFRIAEYLGGSFLLALIGIITGYVIRR